MEGVLVTKLVGLVFPRNNANYTEEVHFESYLTNGKCCQNLVSNTNNSLSVHATIIVSKICPKMQLFAKS